MEGRKLFDYDKENEITESSKKDEEKDGKLLLKILQIVIGIIMGAFHL